MYVPAHFTPSPTMVADLLASPGLCDLVTSSAAGLESTPLPLLYDASLGEHGTLTGHMALVNPQWQPFGGAGEGLADAGECLVVVRGPEHYMSPSWRPRTSLVSGATAPTWNYLVLHVYGTLRVHRGAEAHDWLLDHLRGLSDHYEAAMTEPWSMERVGTRWLEGQLRALVGVEVVIDRVLAKAKLAQNLNEADRAAVVAALRERGDDAGAAALEEAWTSHAEAMHPWLRAARAGQQPGDAPAPQGR